MRQTQEMRVLVRTRIAEHQRSCCALARARGYWAPIVQYHHRMHDTLPNRIRFPLLIHSMFNLVGVCANEHLRQPSALPMSLLEAASRERFLARHPRAALYLNGAPRVEGL